MAKVIGEHCRWRQRPAQVSPPACRAGHGARPIGAIHASILQPCWPRAPNPLPGHVSRLSRQLINLKQQHALSQAQLAGGAAPKLLRPQASQVWRPGGIIQLSIRLSQPAHCCCCRFQLRGVQVGGVMVHICGVVGTGEVPCRTLWTGQVILHIVRDAEAASR